MGFLNRYSFTLQGFLCQDFFIILIYFLHTYSAMSRFWINELQSLVERLNLSGEEVTIQPVHPSIMGQVSHHHHTTVSIAQKKGKTVKIFCCHLAPTAATSWRFPCHSSYSCILPRAPVIRWAPTHSNKVYGVTPHTHHLVPTQPVPAPNIHCCTEMYFNEYWCWCILPLLCAAVEKASPLLSSHYNA